MSRRIVMIEGARVDTDPRVRREAEALSAAGYEVVVLAWDRSGTDPATEQRDGWRVESFGPAAGHGGGIRSVPGYRAFWRTAGARAAQLDPAAIHCHDLDTVPAGLSALRALGDRPKLVLDFWELYRESRALPQAGVVGKVARAAARWLERRSIPRSDLLVTVVEGQVDYYRSLGARNVIVVENAPLLGDYRPTQRRDSSELVVCFIGQKRYAPALLSLMEAIQPYPQMHALLVGGGPAEAEIAEAATRYERVTASGRVEKSAIPELYAGSDVVFACYDTALLNWRTAFPVKVQEGMACGLPVIVSKGTWIAEYVAEHGLGLAVDDKDPADVARALVALAEDREAARAMGARGRALVESGLNWDAAVGRLVSAYDRLELTDT